MPQRNRDRVTDDVYGGMLVETDGATTTFKCSDCGAVFVVLRGEFGSFRFDFTPVCCGKLRV